MTGTVSIGHFRDQLRQLLATGKTDEFINRALPYVNQISDDPEIRLLLAQEHLRIGLLGPAADLLGAEGVDWSDEVISLRKKLAALSTGLKTWDSLSAIYESNLTALGNRGVDVELVENCWDKSKWQYELYKDTMGRIHLRKLGQEGQWQWVPTFGDQHAIAQQNDLPPDIDQLQPGPYLFEGVDLGHYFARVYEQTLDTFLGYSCALFVVEPDPVVFAIAMHIMDWRKMLADERVYCFVGKNAAMDLVRAFETNVNLPFPSHAFQRSLFRDETPPKAAEALIDLAEKRQEQIRRSKEDLEQLYDGRDVTYWANRWEEALKPDGSKLRILSSVSIHTSFLQYSMRDAKRAFEKLGHTCEVITEKTNHDVVGILTLHDAIRRFKPDLLFVLDHLRSSYQGIAPTNLPIFTWDQDQLPHVFTKENMRKIFEHDFIAGCSKAVFIGAGCDKRQYLATRIPTCPEQFALTDLTDEEWQRYECDVSFVSHASQTPEAFHNEQRDAQNNPQIQKLLDVLFELLPDALVEHRVVGAAVPSILLAEACRRCGIVSVDDALRNWLATWYLWRAGDRMFRHEALEWVASWAKRTNRTLRIYGNGWDKHPTLSEFAAGPAENGRELVCIYRASKINLQLMPAGFIHQRALDGLASGGLFLARLSPHDLKGNLLKSLMHRCRELNVDSTEKLLTSNDPQIRDLLNQYVGPSLQYLSPTNPHYFAKCLENSELSFPDELFPRFEEIVFDNTQEFEQKADRFLKNREYRESIVEEMRKTVLDCFTYESTMKRFLHSMRNYLRTKADECDNLNESPGD